MTKSTGVRHRVNGGVCGKCGPVTPVEYRGRTLCPNTPRLPQNRRTDPSLLVNHMIESLDVDTREAVCRICGPVIAQTRGGTRYACPNRVSNTQHNHLRSRYGITKSDYDVMYSEQRGRCLICRKEHRLLHVDHDHETNVVRGLLCGKCNRGLGMFDDNPDVLVAAIRYLEGGDAI